ncbi:hypothetical protein FRC10_000655 [Ceratobasidium sp. 414]|nr:hypothetical protein FRC10_000655 [Ceratobasidium sp. 414]
MAPLAVRQLGIASSISKALQSDISTASEGFFGTPSPVVAPTPTPQSATPFVPVPAVQTTSLAQSVAPTTSSIVSQAPVASATPTVSVIIFTTTTGTSNSLVPTIPAVTSSSNIFTSATPTPLPAPITPDVPDVATTSVPDVATTSLPLSSSSASPSGIAAGAGTGAQISPDKGMSAGIIALIVVGALLVALLAGAFTFRRVQVHRRAKRRENNYGAGPIPDNAPFPFTNVSEADLKGAEPITRDFRQGVAPSMNEKPLPSVAPVMPVYGGSTNPIFNQPGFDSRMSGPYPAMGPVTGYGYGQPGRMASPAPSQAPRMMSPAPPPAAVVRTGSPAFSGPVAPIQYPQSLTPAPAPAFAPAPPPTGALPPHMLGKKRVVQTFQPSLPDELDIRDGDWVTIVHAYDDGWGLCDRNGRRGVVPLECLDLGRPDFRASRRMSSLSAIRQ